METFTPALDWANELIPSVLWILRAWAISATLTLLALVLVARFTVWGRQYWRITGDYFKGHQSIGVWAWLGTLLLSTMISVRIMVLLSYQGNDLFEALQMAFTARGAGNEAARQVAISGFWQSLIVFGILAAIFISRALLDIYLTQRFIIRWRTWLTDRLTGDWLADRAYYRSRFTDTDTDSPDQRIQLDIDIFTTGAGGTPNQPTAGTASMLLFGAIN